MMKLELLAPARNADIGIAAISCGADAVYIAGPSFGARKDAGNPISEVERLCNFAHQFGARIFLTVNISLKDDEIEKVHSMMLQAQAAGVDAFIIRDERICRWNDITRPLHASTQCAIRTPERALHFQRLGCTRIVLERELSLRQVEEIRKAVSCELEFFVHGALCVCYSGECTLSEHINGRSADRGECIQACRSLYDLVDENGKVLVKNKALLSLKDLNLSGRIAELAQAGIMSFKIEGRLKNESYVKNVTLEYSKVLDKLVAANPDKYCRASFGKVRAGFEPDSRKTFNRGYTELFLDEKRGEWSSMDIPKSIGEKVGTVTAIKDKGDRNLMLFVNLAGKDIRLKNGDGFSFAARDGVTGFRADIAEGNRIICKNISGLQQGVTLFRNISSEFEKLIDGKPCSREIGIKILMTLGKEVISAKAVREDGAELCFSTPCPSETSINKDRTLAMIRDGIAKRSGIYSFSLESIDLDCDSVPLLSSSFINNIRREIADRMAEIPVDRGAQKVTRIEEEPLMTQQTAPYLMRSKYCIKYELGLCSRHFRCAPCGRLSLRNNGRFFPLEFDCKSCEMIVNA